MQQAAGPRQQGQQQQQQQQQQKQKQELSTATTGQAGESPLSSGKKDRRLSDEWDAAKVPPSRFQKRKGSIYATPSSRDGHIDKNYAEKYHAKIAEMKGGK
ncbi:c6 zinc finger domain containing [Trichoderma cornu-damae]|uniref:C6 zinc finger domain containing n=1 Tax=Trichoderma cornu-damae TaxID=654480 RepID=A0A9P8TWX2_9HYPO|nr:c6 zinc finger domain containing [Trichoderma cornu-damae]